MHHYSAHYFCKTIIKLCAQIADKAVNYCLQSQGIRHAFIYITGRWFELTTGYVADKLNHC
ncbi:hypothetical protein EVY00_12015 [Citrobacter werkmanii]|nr:hypothetical protein EVY00_12015 [Citrobacter werkmanii]